MLLPAEPVRQVPPERPLVERPAENFRSKKEKKSYPACRSRRKGEKKAGDETYGRPHGDELDCYV